MLVCMTSLMINAQEALNGNYFNEDFKISLKVNLAEKTISNIKELKAKSGDTLAEERYNKFRNFGKFLNEA